MRFSQFLLLLESMDPELRRNRKEIVKHFSKLSNYSEWNAEHSANVLVLARDFAKSIGLNPIRLERGILTHDIGKVKIPKDILHKSGVLNSEERKIMNTHTKHSHELLSNLTGDYAKDAKLIASYHHTKVSELDKLKDDGILSEDDVLTIKIMIICDIFEALTGIRPYKKSHSFSDAFELMKKSDNVDKDILKDFIYWHKSHYANLYRDKSSKI